MPTRASSTRSRRRPASDRLVDLVEGGARTGYASETLRKYVGRPDGPPFHKYGGRWMAWLSDLDAWSESRREAS